METDVPFQENLLRGSVAMVTGGGSGLGRGIAEALALCGSDVAVLGRRRERLDEVVSRVEQVGRRACAVTCDVRDPEAVENAVATAEDQLGPVNLLVNNAGATFTAPADQLTPNGFRAVVETDAFGTFYMSRSVGRRIISRGGGGAIVNITSTSPLTGNPGRLHGGVGKAGVESLTKTLAVEWGPHGIRVNSVAPGYTPTQGVNRATRMDEASDGNVQRVVGSVPLRRVGRIEDIAWPVVFLLSPAAGFVNGASLIVDGGKWLSSGRGFADEAPAPN